MHILLLHQYFQEENEPGGVRFNEMTRIWHAEGHNVTVICGMLKFGGMEKTEEYKGKYFVKKKQGGVNVIRCHVSEAYNKGFFGRLFGYFSFMFNAIYAGLFIAKDKYDKIVVTSPPLFIGVCGYVLSRAKGIPYIFEVRDLWPESAIDTGLLKNKTIIRLSYWLESFIYRNAKLINVLTPAFRKTLIEKKGMAPEKVIMIPNASDFELSDHLHDTFDRDAFRKEHDLDDKFVISYLGAHGIANHLEQILETAERLRDTNVLFLFIGEGPRKSDLKKMAADMKLTNVRFIDAVPKSEVFKYIIASEMGTSVLKRVDTFKTVYSNKTFDYMACKKPILMAIDGVSRELVEEADCGCYVEPEDPAHFEKIIREYLLNDAKRLMQGENGYRYAKQNFDRNVLALKYLEILKNV